MTINPYVEINNWSHERKMRAQKLFKAESESLEHLFDALLAKGRVECRKRVNDISAKHVFPWPAQLWLASMLFPWFVVPFLNLNLGGFLLISLYSLVAPILANRAIDKGLAAHKADLETIQFEDVLRDLLNSTEEPQ
jgi:hypothetical protein